MNRINAILLVALLTFSSFGLVIATPNGADPVTSGASTRADPTDAQNHTAIAGNVTELTVYGSTVTQSWQGYFGNVSGSIQLADGSGNAMYNWSLASPQGEVFASSASTITWSSIACFDLATNGAALEGAFGIDPTDADGVDETFASNDHDQFYVGSTDFTVGQCNNTKIFDDTGAGVNNNFEEVLLTDGTNTVFASLLEEDLTGFDGKSHDFQMLVLENGHAGDSATTPYFFYIELE